MQTCLMILCFACSGLGSSNCSIEFGAERFMIESLQVVFVCHEQTSDIVLVYTWLVLDRKGLEQSLA